MDKALIVMSSGPATPQRCATPFYMATMGVAMDYEVAIFFTIDGTLLLKRGVAEMVFPKPGAKPLSAFIQEAQEAGVLLLACTASTDLHELQPADLIPGVKMVGAATMWELAEASKIVFSF